MTELDQTDVTGVSAADAGERGMPRWVRIFIAVTAVVTLAFVGTKLLGMDHGPGRHGGSDPPAADNNDGHSSPGDH